MSQEEKNNLIERAKLAQAAERYEDMASFINLAIKCGFPLNKEEIDLFVTAFKKIADARRSSLQSINFTETKEASEINLQRINIFKRNVKSELEKICYDVLHLLDDFLIPVCDNTESRILFNKFKGDYYRNLVRVVPEDKNKDVLIKAYGAYDEAYETSKLSLNAAHPVRLGVALDFSVCCHNVLHDIKKAILVAKEAIAAANEDLDNVQPDTFVATTISYHCLRDNLMMWKMSLSDTSDTDISGNISNESSCSTRTEIKNEINEDKSCISSNNESINHDKNDCISAILPRVDKLVGLQELNLKTHNNDQFEADVSANITNLFEAKTDFSEDSLNEFICTTSTNDMIQSNKTNDSLGSTFSRINKHTCIDGTLKDEQIDLDGSINKNKTEMKSNTTERNGSEFESSCKHKLHDNHDDIVKCKKIKASWCKDVTRFCLNKDDGTEIGTNSVETMREDIYIKSF